MLLSGTDLYSEACEETISRHHGKIITHLMLVGLLHIYTCIQIHTVCIYIYTLSHTYLFYMFSMHVHTVH